MPLKRQLRLPAAGVFTLLAAWFAYTFLYRGMGGEGLLAQVFNGGGLNNGLSQAGTQLSGSGVRNDTDVLPAIASVVNFALTFAAVAAFVAFVVAGFMFILGFGSENTVQRAKKIMIWSGVGLVVILFSLVITQFIVSFATA